MDNQNQQAGWATQRAPGSLDGAAFAPAGVVMAVLLTPAREEYRLQEKTCRNIW